MTDKSFGDYPNRNIVKNPLLSSAVTGLSLEDLTHNAVLLPVSRTQEVITRPDEQNRPLTTPLESTENAVSTHHAGDANSNRLLQSTSQTAPTNVITMNTNQKPDQNPVKPHQTQSKASVKSDDDFDVNEYFARLHGTRYVSAPLNSNLKEDSNANLEATEENLEEINLNEPDKPDVAQQSLTADIAQNFSQLPTVLPQMASAVFTSFSNMLHTKRSREPTPEVTSGYLDIQFERPEPSPIAAPPKEPPTLPPSVGTANYRLPPKKKYAQIPGLSSGEAAPIPFQSHSQNLPPANQNTPRYFTPSLDNSQNESPQTNIDLQNNNINSIIPNYVVPTNDDKKQKEESNNIKIDRDNNKETHSVALDNAPLSTGSGKEANVNIFPSNSSTPQPQFYSQDINATLPPPPMFANIPRRDSQSDKGKSVLPPSVARRISSKQPIIKQSTQIPQIPSNIFIPAPLQDSLQQETSPYLPMYAQAKSCIPPPANDLAQISKQVSQLSIDRPPQTTVSQFSLGADYSSPLPGTIYVPLKTEGPAGDYIKPTTSMPASLPTNDHMAEPLQPSIGNMPPCNAEVPRSLFMSSETQPSNTAPLVPPTMYPTSNTQTLPPSMFTPRATPVSASNVQTSESITSPVLPNSSQKSLPTPLTYFTSTTSAESKEFPPIASQTSPKPMPQPPKASGNVNFRMTKKRPQYYSGPLGGVGDISNNIKPVMPGAVNETPMSVAFQGDLFTPAGDNNQTQIGQPESAPFDISKPSKPVYPMVGDTPQTQFCSTAFDMSRPTTESFSEPKQESTGFGLLGSLKSKLTSLDINKIQNSVTTFFDPDYNNSKKEEHSEKPQENYPYEQPRQYGQTQNNFEIFVSNVEQTNLNYNQSYLYQMQFQNQFHYNQQQQAYLSNEPHNYYQNQGYHGQHHQNQDQNISSYFGNTSQHYQTPIGPTTMYPAHNPQASLLPSVPCAQQNTVVPKTSVQEIQQTYFANPNYQSQDSIQAQISSESGSEIKEPFPSYAPSSDVSNMSLHNQGYKENAHDVSSKNLFDTLPHNQLSQKDNSDLSDQNVGLGVDSSKNFFVNSKSETKSENIAELTQSGGEILPEALQNIANEASQKNLEFIQPNSQQSRNSFKTPTFSVPETQHQIADNASKQDENTISNQIKPGLISDAGVFKMSSTGSQTTLFQGVPTPTKTEDFKPSEIISTNIKDVMFKLQTNPADFFGSFNQAVVTKDNSFSQLSIECKSEISKEEQKRHELITESSGNSPDITTTSGPLLGLSNMLADKTKELNDLQDEIKNMVIRETSDGEALFNRNARLNFTDSFVTEAESDPSDLNICETCREIERPDNLEEKEDLTTQMIENITSPICLENAVEVPLAESNAAVEQRDEFNNNQCAEISHITEETIDIIQVHSATELLDAVPSKEYGWSTDEVSVVPTNIDEHSFQLPSFQSANLDNDFNLAMSIDPNSIGFFGINNLFENITTNIGAELKAEFEDKDVAPIILPRQISAPTAPPEEEDKSDGIDVHSIEQDASKDFPLFEEYVIEPTKDSDEEIEDIHESSGNIESFIRRVDKYKKIEDTEITEKISPAFNLSTSPPKTMASYFDTGNYAVETHYRNSLTSPISLPFEPPNPMRVPPGFEEEFHKRISFQEDIFGEGSGPCIPETQTQTNHTYSPTFSTAQTLATISTYVTTSLLASVQGYIDTTAKLTELPKGFGGHVSPDSTHITALANPIGKFGDCSENKEEPVTVAHVENPQTNFTDLFYFGQKKDDVASEPTLVEKIPRAPLPDPLNFFVENTESSAKSDDQGFNRLASYFSSPAKTDHTKSFFELSESQNHYRHSIGTNKTNPNPDNNLKENIPPDQYLANVNLMRDLTSLQNPDFQPEQTVRTVNYFTIEYDKSHVLSEFSRGEPDLKHCENPCNNINPLDNVEAVPDDNTVINIMQKCKHCCNVAERERKLDTSNPEVMMVFKVKKCMDNMTSPEEKKDDIVIMEQDSKINTNSILTNFGTEPKENNSEDIAVATENRTAAEYMPVRHHWFYRVDVEGKSIWRGFSIVDSKALEEAYCSPDLSDNTLVPTDGGRYDVNVRGRLRFAVYWSDKPSNVRRCSWFYKGTTDARYVPYTEDVAKTLEEEYRHGITTGEWHRRLVLPNNEMVVMHGPAVMVHFLQANSSDAFSSAPLFPFGKRVYRNPPKIRVARDQPRQIDHLVLLVHGAGEYRHQKEKIQSTMRPRVVRRGHDESEIEDVEPSSIDHLLLLCHGVGSACDMRFRNVEEVVDDFRATSLQLIQSHYKNSYDSGVVGRVEVLPISWHETLHSGETGVDKRLARVTLDSIPKLRSFTNDTVLDVLFYTSPVFCQTIINTVSAELNRIYKLFRARNPNFKGGVSLGGHSLGSVILYDLLCHQQAKPVSPGDERKQYVRGAAGSGQLTVKYPPLDFRPDALYALGSPIAIFECIRGVENLGLTFSLPTCKSFFNIFHPYDPIAYRIEPLINPALQDVKPHLIPHHKGRKRMHLELKDTMARVGADIKQKLIESIKTTWSSMWKAPPPDSHLEKVVEEELEKEPLSDEPKEREETSTEHEVTPDMLGKLNGGRRVDYVLQEAPFEMINEYLFAMSSHVCYWESEDTMLMMLREIYDSLGVQPDSTVPQSNLTVQRTKVLQDEIVRNTLRKDNPSTSKGWVLGE